MSFRKFGQSDFRHVGQIEPERDADGALVQLMPQGRYTEAANTPLHPYGAGPFCRFRIGRALREPGLYVLTLDGEPVYAGECEDLARRWGPNGYGSISPRNCFRGGQPTNCRVNAAILAASLQGLSLDLWFRPLDGDKSGRLAAETHLIEALVPSWNRAKISLSRITVTVHSIARYGGW